MNRANSAGARQTPHVDALVRERVGLDVRHLDGAEQSRRIYQAMQSAGFRDDAAYANYLRAAPRALMDLASLLSVGETYFFRDPDQLDELTRVVLPRLLIERPRDHHLQIWSAGCSSGEEAYTIAMLLDERGLLERASIVGTDLSEDSLTRARRGVYGQWSLRAISKITARRYLERIGDKYHVVPELRAHVTFERQSLTDEHAPMPGGVTRGFDLIFCKNVLIYLTDSACRQVSERLCRSLLPRGTLLTGAADNFKELPSWTKRASAAGVMFERAANGPRPVVPDLKWSIEASRRAVEELPEPSPPSERPAKRDEDPEEQPALSIDSLRSALQKHPRSEALHMQLASLLIELDRDAEAEAALRTLLYLDRELVIAHFLLALLHQRRGHKERALRAYMRVISLCSAQPEDEAVKLGDGVSHKLLSESARDNARALEQTTRRV